MTYDLAIIVCGGRDYSNRARLFRSLDLAASDVDTMLLIHGAARGADSLANEWGNTQIERWLRTGKSFCLTLEPHPADWQSHGKAAGPIRNRAMLARLVEAQAKRRGVIAFPGGTGTRDMVTIAHAAGVSVWHPDPLT